jgi:hypothetical protein
MVHIIPLSIAQRPTDAGNEAQAARPLDPYWQEVADHYARRMARQQAFDTEIAARRLDGEIARAEADTVADAPADGEGLHHAMYGEVDRRTGRVVEKGLFDTLFDNFLKQVPPELHPGLASRKETLRAAGSTRMAMQQRQRRGQYEQDHLTAVQAEELDNIAKSDPDDMAAFDAARHAGLDLLAKMNLDPESRQKAETAWRASTARTRMEALIARDPERAAEMLSAGPVESDRQAGAQTTEPRADLSPDDTRRLLRQAHAATVTRLVEARANIDLAAQNAPDAIANTGNYSGVVPSLADFVDVYGEEEGGKRYQDFSRKIDVGRQAFGMRAMPNQAIHAALRDAEPTPGSSDDDRIRYQITAAAALSTLLMRRTDPAGYVRDVFPDVDAAWRAAKDPGYPIAYQVAIARSIAAQEQLGFENIQPLPKSRSADLIETLPIDERRHDASDTADTLDAPADVSGLKSGSGQFSAASENQPDQSTLVVREQSENSYPSVNVAGISKSAARNLCIEFCTNATLPTGTYDGAPFHYCMARCMENYGH